MEPLAYSELVRRWEKVKRGKLFLAGRASGYPIYGWRHEGAGSAVYLSTGIHGDEPAGPMAVTRLLEKLPSWFCRCSWVIFPCLNPWGYENGLRRNQKRLDLNRLWRDKREPEIRAVRNAIHGKQFNLAYLMHEDYDAKGFYLYELAGDGVFAGKQIIREVRSILPIENRRSIEGRRVSAPGLICRDSSYRMEGRKFWPEAFHLFHGHTRHLFNAETPSTGFDLRLRIQAQIKGLRVAVGLLEDS